MKRFQPICVALFLVCTAAAGIAYWLETRRQPVQPNFIVTPTAFDLPNITEGTHELTLRITNPASVPRRIIGLQEA